MSSTLTGILIAPVDQCGNVIHYDGIGRVFTTNSGSRFIRIDIWPIKPFWESISYIVSKSWKPNDDYPEIKAEEKESLQLVGNLGIITEQWTTPDKQNKRIPRTIGHFYTANTKKGIVESCRFIAVPANPHWYTHNGTISMFSNSATQEPTTH